MRPPRDRGHLDSPEAQGRMKAREKDRRRQQDEDLRAVLSTAQGRRFVFRLLDEVCALSSGTFTGNSETFWREGRRSVAVDLLRETQRVAPELYVQALNEQLAERVTETVHRQAAESLPTESD